MKTPTVSRQGGEELLARMGQIPLIVPGKLSERRTGGKVTGYKLQHWRAGRNQTRHVPAGKLETVRRGIQGYAEFLDLAEQYVQRRAQEAFASPADSKKKPIKP
jgi:hypothetical protein